MKTTPHSSNALPVEIGTTARLELSFKRSIISLLFFLGIALFSAINICAEQHPEALKSGLQDHFDVTSVHPSSPSKPGSSIDPQLHRFEANGVNLIFLLQIAYDLHEFQILNAPAWAKNQRFDVTGTMDEERSGYPGAQDEMILRQRLRALLQDRFGIAAHEGMRSMPQLQLVFYKVSKKLVPSANNEGYSVSPGYLNCSYMTLEGLSRLLSDQLGRPVVDRTGLQGSFKIVLKWNPDLRDDNPSVEPDIYTALKEQLGLALKPTKGPVKVLVIDRSHLPSAN